MLTQIENMIEDTGAEPLTDEERYELAKFYQQEQTERTTRVDFRNAIRQQNDGKDIVDICHSRGDSLESFDGIAKLMGYHQPTWSDGRNVARREKETTAKVKSTGSVIGTVVHTKTGAVESTPDAPKKEKIKKAAVAPEVEAGLPSVPNTTDREKLTTWAREYCRALCDRHQSAKLVKKLFGGPENPGGGSCAWQISVMPLDDDSLMTWAASARLSFDKKVGA